ncbi:hypothetical protein CEP51_004748 [Fusarium floridanum]|uniref:Uncharacterized protein n=1 Tax=Fusarium floridanum TaxID=1325733 RepID=A0A428RZU0_9HYPO|nr:hypothetical protein CEP51_004748 [Fusarium floridanum]
MCKLMSLYATEPGPRKQDILSCLTRRQLMDESIHLISWQDELCVDMVRITYEGMWERGMKDECVSWGYVHYGV